MGLSVREILILDYFDGKPVHAKMPSYLYATYGSDADLCLDRLYADGWIRESTPRETVNMLPDKALSDFLKRYGLSGEGSHTELVRRIIHEVPEKIITTLYRKYTCWNLRGVPRWDAIWRMS